jgi:hypothetical protein
MGTNSEGKAEFPVNEGNIDRAVRVIAGLLLAVLGLMMQRTWLGLIGLLPLMTGIVGYCPLYRLLGITTCPAANRRR